MGLAFRILGCRVLGSHDGTAPKIGPQMKYRGILPLLHSMPYAKFNGPQPELASMLGLVLEGLDGVWGLLDLDS